MTDSARRSPVVNNYLATAPDLTEAKNKAIDADIADFSQFIEDTIAIEKQRLRNQDSRLKSLFSLTESGIKIAKGLETRQQKAQDLQSYMNTFDELTADADAQTELEKDSGRS